MQGAVARFDPAAAPDSVTTSLTVVTLCDILHPIYYIQNIIVSLLTFAHYITT